VGKSVLSLGVCHLTKRLMQSRGRQLHKHTSIYPHNSHEERVAEETSIIENTLPSTVKLSIGYPLHVVASEMFRVENFLDCFFASVIELFTSFLLLMLIPLVTHGPQRGLFAFLYACEVEATRFQMAVTYAAVYCGFCVLKVGALLAFSNMLIGRALPRGRKDLYGILAEMFSNDFRMAKYFSSTIFLVLVLAHCLLGIHFGVPAFVSRILNIDLIDMVQNSTQESTNLYI